jgi:hypothetical protein
VADSSPDFLKSATNLMTNNSTPALAFGKLFNIRVLGMLKYQHPFLFDVRLFLDPFSARPYSAKGIKESSIEAFAKKKPFLLMCLNPITLFATFVTDMTCHIIMGSKVYSN